MKTVHFHVKIECLFPLSPRQHMQLVQPPYVSITRRKGCKPFLNLDGCRRQYRLHIKECSPRLDPWARKNSLSEQPVLYMVGPALNQVSFSLSYLVSQYLQKCCKYHLKETLLICSCGPHFYCLLIVFLLQIHYKVSYQVVCSLGQKGSLLSKKQPHSPS